MLGSPRGGLVGAATAAAGHLMIFVGFLQPWIAGQFGARTRLTGLDLVRVTDGLIDHGLAGDALTLPVTRLALFALPVIAANGLLVLVLAALNIVGHSPARHLTAALALPAALVTAVAFVLVVLSATGEGVVDGPGFGLVIVAAGASLAIGSWLIGREPTREHEGARVGVSPDADGAVSEA